MTTESYVDQVAEPLDLDPATGQSLDGPFERRSGTGMREIVNKAWLTYSNGEPGHDMHAFRAGVHAVLDALQARDSFNETGQGMTLGDCIVSAVQHINEAKSLEE